MHTLPTDWSALCLLVFLLGARHGLDADHLATIDGLTRLRAQVHPRSARLCGSLFSLGHGLVVLAVALGVSLAAQNWQVPRWLEASGAWVSISCLALLGLSNLHAVLTTPLHQPVQLRGLRSRLLARWSGSATPWSALVVGALFALSFDTVSQAALFALAAGQFGAWDRALALGGLFVLGMLCTDGVNGLWISHLIARADRLALIASRTMSLVVASLSLAVAALGAAKFFSPDVDAWLDGRELLLGLGIIATAALGYLVARSRARAPITATQRA